MKWEMWDAIDMNCEAVVGDDVLAGAHIVDAGCAAIGRGDIIAGTRVVERGIEGYE